MWILCQYIVNFAIILWIFPRFCAFCQYFVNLLSIFCEFCQYFVNFTNILWILRSELEVYFFFLKDFLNMKKWGVRTGGWTADSCSMPAGHIWFGKCQHEQWRPLGARGLSCIPGRMAAEKDFKKYPKTSETPMSSGNLTVLFLSALIREWNFGIKDRKSVWNRKRNLANKLFLGLKQFKKFPKL